jgi:hypothetical protein
MISTESSQTKVMEALRLGAYHRRASSRFMSRIVALVSASG